MNLLLGYDIGSSSVKACLLDADSGRPLASATSPATEMPIRAPHPGWAEQDPEDWWKHVCLATAQLRHHRRFDPARLLAIGISYQMHGLVAVDKRRRVLRPAIIWCDSRAVDIGRRAAAEIGGKTCLRRLLNLPGNFTASKLRWVKENEPRIFSRIHKIMLPGDYIAMRMTDRILTTASGLSEAILWDYRDEAPALFLMDRLGIPPEFLPIVAASLSPQGFLTANAARALGLRAGTPLTYRAGDQPNNALSLRVLDPGETAVTAGTSGVVYGIADRALSDPLSRVNTFLHVNHALDRKRYGVLLCLNGAGILNAWLRREFSGHAGPLPYDRMNRMAAAVAPGSEGLFLLPYGNGAERTLDNRNPGASLHGWNFNTHTRAHLFRAAQEGIVFALHHGLDIMRRMGVRVQTVRAGHANMFLSPLFAQTFASVTGATVELFHTDGAQGAARGAGIGARVYPSVNAAFAGLRPVKTIRPNPALRARYAALYDEWKTILARTLQNHGR